MFINWIRKLYFSRVALINAVVLKAVIYLERLLSMYKLNRLDLIYSKCNTILKLKCY